MAAYIMATPAFLGNTMVTLAEEKFKLSSHMYSSMKNNVHSE